MTYRTTEDFLKMFGLKSLKELPKLPKYKLDSNRQIVIDDIEDLFEETNTENDIKYEAPMPSENIIQNKKLKEKETNINE